MAEATTQTVVRAYRFALDPTLTQDRVLRSHQGGARVAFNRMLAEVKTTLEARAWERRLLGGALTGAQGWSLAALRRTWNRLKHDEFPWWVLTRRRRTTPACNSWRTRSTTGHSPGRAPAPASRWGSPVPQEGAVAVDQVHDRHHPCRGCPASQHPAGGWPDQDARVHPQARPPAGQRHRTDHSATVTQTAVAAGRCPSPARSSSRSDVERGRPMRDGWAAGSASTLAPAHS